MQRRVLLLVELVAMVERMEETGLISLGLSRTAQAKATMRRRKGREKRRIRPKKANLRSRKWALSLGKSQRVPISGLKAV